MMKYASRVGRVGALGCILAFRAVALGSVYDAVALPVQPKLGYGYEPSNMLFLMQSPFADEAGIESRVVWENPNGAGISRYRLDFGSSRRTSDSTFSLSTEIAARSKWAGASVEASFYGSVSSSDESSELSVNLVVETDYGMQYLPTIMPSDLKAIAKGYVESGSLGEASWKDRYGTEVVVARRRGMRVSVHMYFSSSSSEKSRALEASLKAKAKFGAGNFSLDSSFKSIVTTELAAKRCRIEVDALGGTDGFIHIGDSNNSPAKTFDQWLTTVDGYLAGFNAGNSAVTHWYTVPHTLYFADAAEKPFTLGAGVVWDRYLGVSATIDKIDDILSAEDNPDRLGYKLGQYSWIRPDELAYLRKRKPALKAHRDELQLLGSKFVTDPQNASLSSLPNDVFVRFPKMRVKWQWDIVQPRQDGLAVVDVYIDVSGGEVQESSVRLKSPADGHADYVGEVSAANDLPVGVRRFVFRGVQQVQGNQGWTLVMRNPDGNDEPVVEEFWVIPY